MIISASITSLTTAIILIYARPIKSISQHISPWLHDLSLDLYYEGHIDDHDQLIDPNSSRDAKSKLIIDLIDDDIIDNGLVIDRLLSFPVAGTESIFLK